MRLVVDAACCSVDPGRGECESGPVGRCEEVEAEEPRMSRVSVRGSKIGRASFGPTMASSSSPYYIRR
jgi:hypothetical protein